jgi:glycosyltransferase involved in cell wall biosynthesis
MRVLLNVLATAELKTGVGQYTAGLLHGLRRLAGDDEIECFPGPIVRQVYRAWRRLSRGNAKTAGSAMSASGSAPVPPGIGRRLAACLRRPGRTLRSAYFRSRYHLRGCDLYHEPNCFPLVGDVPTVVTLHDLSVLLHPEWHPAERVAYYEQHFQRALSRCLHVLAVSEFTRREVLRHLGLPPARVSRTYNGVRAGLAPLPAAEVEAARRRLGLPANYLLYVGTIEPRKNVLTLLRAYCDLPAALRQRYPLVLAGGWGWGVAEVAAFLDGEGRPKGIIHRGYVHDVDLPALYNGARALAYPSLYEGFGLPPVEMLACGGAVLASTAGAVAETAGSQAHLVEPLDVAGWRDALARVCTEDEWWQQLRRGAREAVRSFTWERCAADTLRVYRTLAGQPEPLACAVA